MGVGGQRHTVALYPWKENRYPLQGGQVGPRAGPEWCGIFRPQQDSISEPPSP
jgi:hypothetical protein